MNEISEAAAQEILSHKLIAIVRNQRPESMRRLADALVAGGIHCMEITFRPGDPASWRGTLSGIETLARNYAGVVLPGAGTVITREQLCLARDAGARYVVSPGMNEEIIRETKRFGLVSFPGALTPTEIIAAHAAGADAVKVFPAGNLGAGYIRALTAPLAHIKLMAVGGVNERNAAEFLRAGCVGLGVGGNLVNSEWIAAGEWGRITDLAKQYVEAVQG